MIPDRTVEIAAKAMAGDPTMWEHATDAYRDLLRVRARTVLERVEGTMEQDYANARCRLGERTGSCPTCGAEWR